MVAAFAANGLDSDSWISSIEQSRRAGDRLMRFHSTRNAGETATLSEALARGIAPDGGLYVPDSFPQFSVQDFDGLDGIAQVAPRFLAPLFAGDPLESQLPAIVAEAFDFPVPVKPLPVAHDAAVLEALSTARRPPFKDFRRALFGGVHGAYSTPVGSHD
jgi:threonine synthase